MLHLLDSVLQGVTVAGGCQTQKSWTPDWQGCPDYLTDRQ